MKTPGNFFSKKREGLGRLDPLRQALEIQANDQKTRSKKSGALSIRKGRRPKLIEVVGMKCVMR